MKYRLYLIPLLCLTFSQAVFAVSESDSIYARTDTLVKGDTLFVIYTACAPICSSNVRMLITLHRKKKDTIIEQSLPCPLPYAVFPEAYIEDRRIRWRDNTPKDE